jgi:hypothetical protein
MDRKIYSLILLLSLIGGLAGGILANHFFVTAPVLAAKTVEVQKIVAAEEFHLVDKQGRVLSTLGMYAGGNPIWRYVMKPAKSAFRFLSMITAILT